MPQLLTSLCRFLHVPLQQAPPVPQLLPHFPQLPASFCMSTHAPLQQVCPNKQLRSLVHAQRPLTQLKLRGQTVPQLPQFAAFVFRLASQPLAALPSQLP